MVIYKNLEKTSIRKVHENDTASPSNKVVAMSSTSPPALNGGHMTKADRRIITEKLDDIHDGDRYAADWSDENVAKDLGVPRNWVSQIRDEYFGPDINEKTSLMADTAKLLSEIRTEHDKMVKKCDTLLAEAMQLEGRLEQIKHNKYG